MSTGMKYDVCDGCEWSRDCDIEEVTCNAIAKLKETEAKLKEGVGRLSRLSSAVDVLVALLEQGEKPEQPKDGES